MFDLRRRQRVSRSVGHSSASGWRRFLIVALVAPLTLSGCLGSAQKAPQGTQEEILQQYREQYEEQADPEAAEGVTDAEQAEALKESLRRGPDKNSTFKVVEGRSEYRIGPGDRLKITSFIEPVPTETLLTVRSDGTIFYARFELGSVQAEGLSASELANVLTSRLRPFVPTAQVTVEVEQFNAWHAVVTGEIQVLPRGNTGTGRYPIEGPTTIAQFISEHGGPSPSADLSDVRLLRDGVELSLDISSARAGLSPEEDLYLDAGDVVTLPSAVEGSSRFYVLGEVRAPGSFRLTQNAHVMDAISLAGSLTEYADAEAVFIGRGDARDPHTIPVNVSAIVSGQVSGESFSLQAGDYVVVPRREPTFWERTREWVILSTLIVNIIIILNLR